MKAYILGPKGSLSDTLASKVFGKSIKIVKKSSFNGIVEAVLKDKGAIGMLGIENSSSSSVHSNVDLIYSHPLFIVGEAIMNFQLHLIGQQNADISKIKKVASHKQALLQCSDFIQKNNLKTIESSSTAAAIEMITKKNDISIGAIAQMESLNSKLKIVTKSITNHKTNMTRWIFVSLSKSSINAVINKFTVIFKIKHIPGSLALVLRKIAEGKGNLTKIESRPLPGTNWEYIFWADIEIADGSIDRFIKIFDNYTLHWRLVGAYARGKIYNE